jgi:uncharacterized C2H2 Zn-finger protein
MPRQRNRSRSPLNIDRYQPDSRSGRDEYYGGSRGRDDRRRGSSAGGPISIDRYVPGQEIMSQPMLVNPVVDPFKLDYQVGFSYFAEWWRQERSLREERERQRTGARRPPDRLKGEREVREERDREKLEIQSAYDAYKEELQSKMARSFVQGHKNEEWFKERYVSEVRDPWRQRLLKSRHGNYALWENQFNRGAFDNFTLEGIYKNDSNGDGGLVEKEEGETVATAEVLGVADLVPSKGGEIQDETLSQPTLLIKTISPTVSRQKLEDFCKEHLGESDGGFKWLSLSDPNPSKRYHRIGWVVLNPGGEGPAAPVETEESNDAEMKTDGEEDKVENGQVKVLGTAARAQEALNSRTIHDETRGDFTCHVGIHNPPLQVRRKALWDLFSAPERVAKDVELASRLVTKLDQEAGGDFEGLPKIEDKIIELSEAGLLKPVTNGVKNEKPKPERDMDVDGSEDGEDGEMEDAEDGAVDEEVDDEALLLQKKKLDLLVEYLRRVHNFCFFCVFESDSVHELFRKCPGGHLRRPRASLSTSAKRAAKASAAGDPFPLRRASMDEGEGESAQNGQKASRNMTKNALQLQRAFNWVKTYEDKVLQLLEPENADIKKLGGFPLEEAISSELAKFVKQEDENKFRCKVPECTKLFKAKSFWEKHVEKRHLEWLESLKEDVGHILDGTQPIADRNLSSSSLSTYTLLTHLILLLLAPMPTAMAISLHPTTSSSLELLEVSI